MKKLTIETLNPGDRVIGTEDHYSGLLGHVDKILFGKDKQSENEEPFDIVVDFEPVADMDRLYSELNGTGVDQLFMGLDQIALVDDKGVTALDAEGNVHLVNDLIRK